MFLAVDMADMVVEELRSLTKRQKTGMTVAGIAAVVLGLGSSGLIIDKQSRILREVPGCEEAYRARKEMEDLAPNLAEDALRKHRTDAEFAKRYDALDARYTSLIKNPQIQETLREYQNYTACGVAALGIALAGAACTVAGLTAMIPRKRRRLQPRTA